MCTGLAASEGVVPMPMPMPMCVVRRQSSGPPCPRLCAPWRWPRGTSSSEAWTSPSKETPGSQPQASRRSWPRPLPCLGTAVPQIQGPPPRASSLGRVRKGPPLCCPSFLRSNSGSWQRRVPWRTALLLRLHNGAVYSSWRAHRGKGRRRVLTPGGCFLLMI